MASLDAVRGHLQHPQRALTSEEVPRFPLHEQTPQGRAARVACCPRRPRSPPRAQQASPTHWGHEAHHQAAHATRACKRPAPEERQLAAPRDLLAHGADATTAAWPAQEPGPGHGALATELWPRRVGLEEGTGTPKPPGSWCRPTAEDSRATCTFWRAGVPFRHAGTKPTRCTSCGQGPTRCPPAGETASRPCLLTVPGAL